MAKRRARRAKNPFKMWGSWIGASISGIASYSYISYQQYLSNLACGVISQEGGACMFSAPNPIYPLLVTIFAVFIGFLLGWFIQSKVLKK